MSIKPMCLRGLYVFTSGLLLSQLLSCASTKRLSPESVIISQMTLEEKVSQLQDRSPPIKRLNIQGYNWWNEGLHGIARAGEATVFPQAIGLAATWDRELLKAVGRTVGTEARAKYNSQTKQGDLPRYYGLTIWSPNINIFRDPRWGRGQETYGEDPFLSGSLASEFIRGLQGPFPEYPLTIASVKHLAAHSGPEGIRHGFDSKASDYDMEATFLPAFRLAVKEGKAASVMCAYNAIKGVPVCASSELITQRLRKDWGFEGYVVTDCGAVYDMQEFHHYRPSEAENAAEVLGAGVDLNCGTGYSSLVEAVGEGKVKPAQLDSALHTLLQVRKRLGLDGHGSPYDEISPQQVHTPAAEKLALEAASKSIVMLKNDGILPLKGGERVAVIGPNADLLESLRGNYHGVMINPKTPLTALRETLGSENVLYAQGSKLAQGVGITIPETALRTHNNQVGLRGEYFDNGNFSGEPSMVRVDRTLNLDLQNHVPAPGLKAQNYSVRWSGYILPPASGEYELGIHLENCWECKPQQHDAVQLFLDNKAIVTHQEKDDVLQAKVKLQRGERHAIRIEFRHHGDWGIRLQWQAPPEALIAEAVAAAKQADIALAFVGLSPDLEGEELSIKVPGFDRGDRLNLALPPPQQQLLKALKTSGKPLVVVVMSGSAVATNWSSEQANALLQAWYPGESGGSALADIFLGKTNPSGRLPVTIYRSESDLPPFENYSMQQRTYRYFTGQALYGFGYGLSYSEFHYGPLNLSSQTLAAGKGVMLSANVSNRSQRDGEEVVQVYLSPPADQLGLQRELVAFQRVILKAGETKQVNFTLPPRALSTVNAEGVRAIRPGQYRLFIGGAQPNEGAVQSEISIIGEASVAL